MEREISLRTDTGERVEQVLAELLMQQFQVFLWKSGSIGGVGGARPGVVSFIVTSISQHFPREAEKIAKKSRSEKIAAGVLEAGRVRSRPK